MLIFKILNYFYLNFKISYYNPPPPAVLAPQINRIYTLNIPGPFYIHNFHLPFGCMHSSARFYKASRDSKEWRNGDSPHHRNFAFRLLSYFTISRNINCKLKPAKYIKGYLLYIHLFFECKSYLL